MILNTLNKFNKLSILLLSFLILISSVNATGWHIAEEILSGNFTGFYDFDNTPTVEGVGLQLRVSGSCSLGEGIKSIGVDGSVNCEAIGDFSINETFANSTYVNVGEINSITSAMIVSGTIVASDVNSSEVQLRVNSSCSVGSSIRAIASDGSVTCEADSDVDTNAGTLCSAGEFLNGDGTCDPVVVDTNTQLSEATVDSYANNNGYLTSETGDISGVTAGTGLTGGGTSGAVTLNVAAGLGILVAADSVAIDSSYTQRRVSSSCAAGSSIRVIASDGTVTCETDDTGGSDTYCTYSAESALSACNAVAGDPCDKRFTYGQQYRTRTITCPGGAFTVISSTQGCFKDAGTSCTCFVSGTQILMSDYTTKNIEDVIVGDYVINELGEMDKVVELHKPIIGLRNTYLINDKVEVTADHPFMTIDGWKVISEEEFSITQSSNYYTQVSNYGVLNVGDILVTKDGLELIKSITKNDERLGNEYVYSFVLENGEAYYADGYLVASIR